MKLSTCPLEVIYFALLVFLLNVIGTNPPSESCNWVCKIDDIHASNVSAALSKTGQMKIEVRVHKRLEQACANFASKENSSSFIEVWISTPASDDRIQPREFSLLSFVIFYFLENLPPFRYFDGKYTEHEVVKISTEISCIFRPTSNKSKRLLANGLDELYSPYFYIRELANFSQNRPFLNHIWTEESVYVSVGFTNPDKKSQTSTENSEYSLQLERLQYNVLLILGHLAWLYLTFYSASFLMLFRTNIATVEIAETVTYAKDPDGEEGTEPGDNSSPEPTDHGCQEDELKGAGQMQQDDNYDSSRTEDERDAAARRNVQFDCVANSLENCDKFALPEQNPNHSSKLVGRRFSTDRATLPPVGNLQTYEFHSSAHPDKNKLSSKLSGTLGSICTTKKESCVVNIAKSDGTGGGALDAERATDAGGLNHRAANRSSSDNTVSETDTIEQDIGQSGAHNQEKKSVKSVCVIYTEGGPSSVSIRSLIANHLLRNKLVKFVFLFFFALFPVSLLDLFLLPSRLFSRIAPRLSSTSITIAVFHFIYEKNPGLLVFLFLHSVRCLCMCFCQSLENRVPSFLFRKHFWCFFVNCYTTKLLFPNNNFSACDECKKTLSDCSNECDFPVNIKRNDEMLLEIPVKDYKDVFLHLFPKYCQRFFPGDENTTNSCSGLLKILSYLVFGIFYIILCALDFLLSTPIICVCYERVWFTANWSADWCQWNRCYRCLQFICFCIEFLIICSSIIWEVYLSICCSVALEIAFVSLFVPCDNSPAKTYLGWAIYIIFCHNLFSRYRSFTYKYENLDSMVSEVCIEDHVEEIKQYQKGDVTNVIPEDLLVSVRNKLIPLKHSVRKLIRDLLLWASILLILLIITSSIKEINIMVLSATVSLLTVFHPCLLDILVNFCKRKELKDALLKDKVKRHVNAYFGNKLV